MVSQQSVREARVALGMLAAKAGQLSADHPVVVLERCIDHLEGEYQAALGLMADVVRIAEAGDDVPEEHQARAYEVLQQARALSNPASVPLAGARTPSAESHAASRGARLQDPASEPEAS